MNYTFSTMHVDIARNSTDDFNLFHDKLKWDQVEGTPFNGPILLGFQLEMLIEGAIRQHRMAQGEHGFIEQEQLNFSNYQFSFANAVKPEQEVSLQVKKSQLSNLEGNLILSNRVSLKANDQLCLMGFKKESRLPLFLPLARLPDLSTLTHATDREYLPDSGFFVKRKFMTTSNAKNFLCSAQQEQSIFFDEIDGKVSFPEIFPCALISSALLEKYQQQGLDFKREPLVYTSHKISIDRVILRQLCSNDCVHILLKQLNNEENNPEHVYECYGIVNQKLLLFRALITLVPMSQKQQ